MKTFKLISLDVLEKGVAREIELVDGLIINKEDDKGTWLFEVYTKAKFLDFFEKKMQADREFVVQVVISKHDNDPATFRVKVRLTKKLNENASIMLQGSLKPNSRRNFAEGLLKELLDQGLGGEKLLEEFRAGLKSKR